VAASGASGAALCTPPSGAPSPQQMQHEIVVTASRESDAAMTTRVSTALAQDPYIFADHVTVTVVNGVVRVGGVVQDLAELFAILQVARRIAGKGRVVNEIDFVPVDFDGN
jgi:osmotically-inducible protein OsmY